MSGLLRSVCQVSVAVFSIGLVVNPTLASEVDVIDVVISKSSGSSDGKFRFAVTLKHPDSGWEHYADKWEVVGADGTIYGTRVLAHPHVNEQPFTRSLNGVVIPASVKQVIIRAGDNLGSAPGKTMTVEIPE